MHWAKLEFTPLEFETCRVSIFIYARQIRIYSVGVWNNNNGNPFASLAPLEFTPLEFETLSRWSKNHDLDVIRIYSVGVWNGLKFADIEISSKIRIYSVGVWNEMNFEKGYLQELIRIYSVGVWN